VNWHQRLRFVARLSAWCLAGAWSIYMASVAVSMSVLNQSEQPISNCIVIWIFSLPTMAVISVGYATAVSVIVDVVQRSWARNVLAFLVAGVVPIVVVDRGGIVFLDYIIPGLVGLAAVCCATTYELRRLGTHGGASYGIALRFGLAISIVCFVGTLLYVCRPVAGYKSWLVRLEPWVDDTEYSSGYSDRGFREVRVGLTEQQVLELVGKPLEVHPSYPGFPETGWQYSRSPGSHSFHLRSVYFRDGLVSKIVDRNYAD
jgi:hypothetical protein